jgi:osmoprotectant transport system substrate-binding protein
MSTNPRPRALFALLAALTLAFTIAACGGDDDTTSAEATSGTEGGTGTAIQENPDNNGVQLTIGSKNFTEEYILGEIYAQALAAAGYDIKTDLNLGDSHVALKALQAGEISGYPDYTSTVLTDLFKFAPEDVPGDAQEALDAAQQDLSDNDLVAYAPTPFSSANAVGLLSSTADQLGVKTISDLQGKSQDLTLYGSPECRQRIDCLLGLQKYYDLQFKSFTPVDIGLRYEVLDKGQADLSILFTTDAQLFVSPDKYTILEDDKQVLPAGNVTFIASKQVADEAGPDFGATIEKVQQNLTLPVMQELNARVDVDKEKPEQAAQEYLQQYGYISG